MDSNLPPPTDVANQSLFYPPPKTNQNPFTTGSPKNQVPGKREADFQESNLKGVGSSAPFYATAPPLLPVDTQLDTGKEDRSIGGGWRGDDSRAHLKRKRVDLKDESRYGKDKHKSMVGWYEAQMAQQDFWQPRLIVIPQEELVRHRWSDTVLFAKEIGNSLVWDPRKRTNRMPTTAEEPVTKGDGYDSFWIEIGYWLAVGAVMVLMVIALDALVSLLGTVNQ